jgi:peptidoglycan/xylan/chitin deacetylase (PgdA/CDA1 family)
MQALDLFVHALSRSAVRSVFRPIVRERATIFMLHRIANADLKIGGHDMEFVREALGALRKSGARFVSVRQLLEECRTGSRSSEYSVAFTIDDGFRDQARLARLAFTQEGCPVTVFLISGFLDGLLWPWDDQLTYIMDRAAGSDLEVVLEGERMSLPLCSPELRLSSLNRLRERCKAASNAHLYEFVDELAQRAGVTLPQRAPEAYTPMTWEDARSLEPLGVEFAPHSVTHRIFSRLTADEARKEIEESWHRLRQELANPLPVFAWPTGRAADYSERDLGLLSQVGISACASADGGYAYTGSKLPLAHGVRDLGRFAFPARIRDVLQYGSWIERGKQIVRGQIDER